MTTFRILLACLLCLAPASADSDSGTIGSVPEERTSALQEILQLDASQLGSLRKFRFELEDAAFPLYQKLIEQDFALQRAYRSDELNPAVLEMLVKDLEHTLAQANELAAKYRAKARALLNSNQRFALYSLENALKLNGAAREAAEANLIEGPRAAGLPFDFLGPGLIDGGYGDVPGSTTNPGSGSDP